MRITVENASFSYNEKDTGMLFDNVCFELESGRIMAILGPNGSGKTTFLRCMMGMLKWTKGRCLFDGKDTSAMSTKEFWDKVSFVPQQRSASSGFTAFENILLGRSGQVAFFGTPGKKDVEAAEKVMEESKCPICRRFILINLDIFLIKDLIINK